MAVYLPASLCGVFGRRLAESASVHAGLMKENSRSTCVSLGRFRETLKETRLCLNRISGGKFQFSRQFFPRLSRETEILLYAPLNAIFLFSYSLPPYFI